MKISKSLLSVGAAFVLSVPLTLSFKQNQPVRVNATEDRNFEIEHDPSRTTNKAIYDYIGEYTVGFNFKYNDEVYGIFTVSEYLNGNQNLVKDENNNVIDVCEGIIINGQTFKYWVEYGKEHYSEIAYPSIDSGGVAGVSQFPMNLNNGGYRYSAVTLRLLNNRIEFRFNLSIFAMDDIKIEFKKDYFYSYNSTDSCNYKLEDDITFYSSINDGEISTSHKPEEKITFVSSRNETITKYGIERVLVSEERLNTSEKPYHYYQIYTNIPRDSYKFKNNVPTDHDRYVYGNILLNGKPLTYYNAVARANKKDFTSLSPATQNPDYETKGPAVGNTTYCLAMRIDLATNAKYIIAVYISDKCLEDFGITNPEFALRDGSSWLSLDENGNSIIVRESPSMFNEKIIEAINEIENSVDLTLYRPGDAEQISQIILEAEADINAATTFAEIDAIVEETKDAVGQFYTKEEASAVEHIQNFVDLLNAIPLTTADQQAFIDAVNAAKDAVNAAKDAYAALTESEKEHLTEEQVNKLLEALYQLDVLYFDNYKQTVKEQINVEIQLDLYRTDERTAIQALIDTAFAAIDAATNRDEVDAAYNVLLSLVVPFKTAATLAKEELDAIDLTVYREEQKAEVQDLIAKGKTLINLSKNAIEVDQALARVLALIAKVKTDAQMSEDEALAPAKEVAKQELTDYANAKGKSNYTVSNWTKIMDYVDMGHFNIDVATSQEEIDTAVSNAKLYIDTVQRKPQESTTEETAEKNCGGSIAVTSVTLSVLALAGLGLVINKKRKEE